MTDRPIRILVVDDTVVYRKIVSDIIADQPDMEVVGIAANGKIALQKIQQLHPDLLTLDLEMPEVDGLGVLRELKKQDNAPGAIMLSAFTSAHAATTINALDLGAFDFVLKPSGGSIEESKKALTDDLCSRIRTFAHTRQLGNTVRDVSDNTAPGPAARVNKKAGFGPGVATDSNLSTGNSHTTGQSNTNQPHQPHASFNAPPANIEVIGLGISTGGPQSLTKMMPSLPGDLPVPMLIVQHMPPMFTRSLAEDLDKKCAISVCEAADGQAIKASCAYIAPGGKQMKIVKINGQAIIKITDDPPENSCKPSVDYLFRSISLAYGANTLAVIMTGMGNDGTLGCRLLKRKGARILLQDKDSCVVYGMPRQPAEEGLADKIAPLDKIADEITKITLGNIVACR